MMGTTWSKLVTGSTIWSNVFSRWRYNVVQLTVSRKSDRKLRGTWEQVRHETTRYTYLQHLEKFCCICMATLNCHVPWSPLMERKKFQLSMWTTCQSGLYSLTSGRVMKYGTTSSAKKDCHITSAQMIYLYNLLWTSPNAIMSHIYQSS